MIITNKFRGVIASALTIVAAGSMMAMTTLGGCKDDGGKDGGNSRKFVDKVIVNAAPDLSSLNVKLVFTSDVKSLLWMNFPIKDYGQLYMTPWTESQPFSVGLDLKLDIQIDPDWIKLQKTMTLPNGVPHGVAHPLYQISSNEPVSEKFDVYGYVDADQREWVGVAPMFKFMNDTNFPDGLSISQVFSRDRDANPTLFASVFGPVVQDGKIKRNGGIALFANARKLVSNNTVVAGGQSEFPGESELALSGKQAEHYKRHPQALLTLRTRLVEGLNNAHK